MMRSANKQPAETQHAYEHPMATLRDDITALSQHLQARASKMHKRLHTRDDRAYWKIRGRQRVLWQVADHLQAMLTSYSSPALFYLALKEYLDYCLEKYAIDAQDEQRPASPGNGLTIQHWRAVGAAQELPAIRRTLSGIVETHTPRSVCHVLSLNGKRLVPCSKGATELLP